MGRPAQSNDLTGQGRHLSSGHTIGHLDGLNWAIGRGWTRCAKPATALGCVRIVPCCARCGRPRGALCGNARVKETPLVWWPSPKNETPPPVFLCQPSCQLFLCLGLSLPANVVARGYGRV